MNTEHLHPLTIKDLLALASDLKQSGETVSALLGTVGEVTKFEHVALMTEYGRRAEKILKDEETHQRLASLRTA